MGLFAVFLSAHPTLLWLELFEGVSILNVTEEPPNLSLLGTTLEPKAPTPPSHEPPSLFLVGLAVIFLLELMAEGIHRTKPGS